MFYTRWFEPVALPLLEKGREVQFRDLALFDAVGHTLRSTTAASHHRYQVLVATISLPPTKKKEGGLL